MKETSIDPIVCKFRKITTSIEEGTRSGRYSGSFHWDIKGYLDQNWVVLAYLEGVDWQGLRRDYKSDDDIIKGCLRHLNQTTEKKKGAKKEPRPKFGKLQPYKAKFVSKDDKQFIIVEFITDERANANFWGSGQSWDGTKVSKKRGRPSKVKEEIIDELNL